MITLLGKMVGRVCGGGGGGGGDGDGNWLLCFALLCGMCAVVVFFVVVVVVVFPLHHENTSI